MKNVSKTAGIILISMIVALTSINQVVAQNRPQQSPAMLPDSTQIVKMVEELSKELSLSESQKTKITELHFAHFMEAKVMMKKNEAEHENSRETMNAFRKELDVQIMTLLNDKQKTEFENFIKNRRPPQKEKQKPRH